MLHFVLAQFVHYLLKNLNDRIFSISCVLEIVQTQSIHQVRVARKKNRHVVIVSSLAKAGHQFLIGEGCDMLFWVRDGKVFNCSEGRKIR